MATAANAYLEQFGTVSSGQLAKQGVVEVIFDFSVKPVVAADALNVFLVPAGARIRGYTIRTDSKPTGGTHGTISLGLTGATTGLANGAQPATAVGDCVIGTTEVSTTTTGKYLVATFGSTQTDGKVTILLDVVVPTPYKLS